MVYTGAASSIPGPLRLLVVNSSQNQEAGRGVGGEACGDVLCSSFDVKIASKTEEKVKRSRLPSRHLRCLHVQSVSSSLHNSLLFIKK